MEINLTDKVSYMSIKILLISLSMGLVFYILPASSRDVIHKWCPPEAGVVKNIEPLVVKETEKINLSTDAIFNFGKSSLNDILPTGRISLDQLVSRINSNNSHVKNIVVTGFTDRLGDDTYNYRLGLERADAVKKYIQGNGISSPITIVSAGKSMPLTNCIGYRPTENLITCLQPDRRVTVDIFWVTPPTTN